MKGNDFITELADADHILIHYADKTKDIFSMTPKDSKVKQVKEYSVAELGEVSTRQIWWTRTVAISSVPS